MQSPCFISNFLEFQIEQICHSDRVHGTKFNSSTGFKNYLDNYEYFIFIIVSNNNWGFNFSGKNFVKIEFNRMLTKKGPDIFVLIASSKKLL